MPLRDEVPIAPQWAVSAERHPRLDGACHPAPQKPTSSARSATTCAASGLTQEGLAELADLNPRTVQKIEADDITILVTTLQRLRAALGCEWKRLLG